MKYSLLTASMAALLLAGCGGSLDGPEPVPLDRVNCARCGMLLSSDANAAQSRAAGQATRFFDDVGCLAGDREARTPGTLRYVRLASGGWASTESARFAISRTVRTPMDHGVLAFATADEARAADRDSQARTWKDVVAHVEAP